MVFVGDAPDYGYRDVAVGFNHACGATTDGKVLCWGDNSTGQLGDNTTVSKVYPTLVVGIDDAVKVIAGYYNTCAITSSGAIKCWGYNNIGQLGDGSTVNRLTPVQVVGLTSSVTDGAMMKYTQSPVAYRTCAIQSGGMWCWGSDSYGGLGNAASLSSSVPVQPVGLSSGVKSIGLEYISTHVGMTDGSLRTWGWNGEGRLGSNQTAAKIFETPLTIPLTDVKQTLGYTYLSTSGTIRGASNNAPTAPDASMGSDNVQASRGSSTMTCGTKSSGAVQCSNLGTVQNATNIVKVDVGTSTSACGLRSDGKIMCWGTNTSGQLGDGTKVSRNNAVIIE
jgi:alpha-tubulin suppressor-like RCC1 family protein